MCADRAPIIPDMRVLPRASARRTVAVTAVLPMLVSAAVLVAPAALAGDGPTVRLPVLVSGLEADADCAKASTSVAKALPWEHQSLELSRAASFSTGAGVKVAVVDTGVSATAPTLAGRVRVLGSAGDDCVGHGTFVAGLIAAAPTKGVAFHGVAPRAEIIAVRGTNERGTPSAASVASGIREAVDAGADVVDVSAALPSTSRELDAAVAYAARHDALIVAAAVPDPPSRTSASSSAPPARDYWPAAAPGVLSVLDLDVKGQRPTKALLPVHVDLAAPGDAVVGIGPRGHGHFIGSGASLAAAYTAGTAALVRSAFPDLTAEQVAQRLVSTAYPDAVSRLDAYAALASVRDRTKVDGTTAAVPESRVSMPDTSDGDRATRMGMLVAALAVGAVLVVGWAAVVVPRGRARGWRPTRH